MNALIPELGSLIILHCEIQKKYMHSIYMYCHALVCIDDEKATLPPYDRSRNAKFAEVRDAIDSSTCKSRRTRRKYAMDALTRMERMGSKELRKGEEDTQG